MHDKTKITPGNRGEAPTFPSATALLWEDDTGSSPLWRRIRLGLSALLVALIFSGLVPTGIELAAAVAGWLLAGWESIGKALTNCWHRQFLDEKALVLITSLGTFLLGAYGEAALLMLIFVLGERLELSAIRRSKQGIRALPEPYPEQVSEVLRDKAPAEQFITGFARYYTPSVIVLALGIALGPPLLFAADFSVWTYRALVVLVASCPCSLVIAIPLTFFAGIGLASRRQIYFKGSNYLTSLARTDAVVFDSTGVLTLDAYQVDQVRAFPGSTASEVIQAAAVAQSRSTGPYATAILAYFGAIPAAFENDSSLEASGRGIVVRSQDHVYLTGNADFLAENKVDGPAPATTEAGELLVARDGQLIGSIRCREALRQDAPAAIEGLRRLGIPRTVLLSSDAAATAGATAARLGIGEVHPNLAQPAKVAFLQELNEDSKGSSLYVGHNAADVPALANSGLGLAIGLPPSGNAVNAADVVIMSTDLGSIPRAIALARRTAAIARQNIVLVLALKAVLLVGGFLGLASVGGAVIANICGVMLAILNAGRLSLTSWQD